MNELEDLTTIDKNSRRSSQNYDLNHNPEDNKFRVADEFYARHDMNNNGFIFHVGNGNAYVSIQSNDESVSYKGKEGFDKGKIFTATNPSEVLTKLDLEGDLSLIEIGEKGGNKYFRISQLSSEDNEEGIGDVTEGSSETESIEQEEETQEQVN